jgi:uncharacterized protein
MNDDARFDCDDANIAHIAEHEVDPVEAEQVVLGDPLDDGFDVVDGEERWAFLGETREGRIQRVVITLRGERMRVITAFEPPMRSKQLFLKMRAGEL